MLRASVLVGMLMMAVPASSRAQEPVPQTVHQGTMACSGPSCGKACREREFTLGRLWSWATYRAGPVPRECRGWVPYVPAPVPPLYTFFLHGWGDPHVITGSHCSSCSRGR